VSERLDEPATAINIRLHGGGNNARCNLGSRRPCDCSSDDRSERCKGAQWQSHPTCRTAVYNPWTMIWLFTHAVKQDEMYLLFTAMAHSILQMHSANCGNNNQVLEIENENYKYKLTDFSITDSHPYRPY